MARNRNDIPERGEGNHEADRRYREHLKRFLAEGRNDAVSRAAQRALDEEAEDLDEAEEKGRSRIAEEDPEITRRL